MLVLASFAPWFQRSAPAQTSATTAQVFLQAHARHQALLQTPPAQRTGADYRAIIALLEPLWSDPQAAGADAARFEAAGLYVDWARDRRDDNAYRQAAQTLLDLLHDTPYTAYRRNAEWALAQIQIYHLHQRQAARVWLKDFSRRYPADPRARLAREQIAGHEVAEPGYFLPAPSPAKLPVHPRVTPPRVVRSSSPSPSPIETAAGAPPPVPPAAPQKSVVPPRDFDVQMGNITGVRVYTNPDATSVVISLRQAETFQRGALPRRHLVYFDISSRGAPDTASSLKKWKVDDGRVLAISMAGHRGYTRVTIETDGAAADRGRLFPNPSRLIVGVKGGSARVRTSAAPRPAKPATPLRDGKTSLTRALGLQLHTIVLDAGHGGHDTGTIGPGNLEEKNVVLDVTLRLGKLLEQRLGLHVVYTRDDDTFIPLQERTAIANRAQADMFVSIHANASPDHSARGIETYYLDLTQDAQALAVAARENAGSNLSMHQLRTVVQKIAQYDKMEESRELARDLQTHLASSSGEADRGVRSAPFVVLIGAHMPSVLAEISFLSNPTDDRRLQSPAYRQRLAEALYAGVLQYAESLSGRPRLGGPTLASTN